MLGRFGSNEKGASMTTPHTPPTQAELDEWKIRARDSAPGTSEVFFCLIAEVERLRADRDEIKSGWSKANDDLNRLTKEVEELRKEQRLSRCPFCLEDDFDAIGLKHHLLAGQCHPWNTTSSPWPAMQQKGEE
jgi:hypothetical protein